ncbi:Bifunctional oligoribonuclease and PAP phosphatase NrnA [bioreactor metagenome]|uniref:Bifunctional oligoribonuclease and PAP phosphatase NrnA n=1 Tax=bioreactor metagenome TaxID=1076179 RepID=A0A645AYX0_9ZZZZ
MNQIIRTLKESDDFILLPHARIDGDALGSCLALARALRMLQKRVFIEFEEEIPRKFTFMLDEDFDVPPGFVPRVVAALDCGGSNMLGEREEKYKGKIDLAIDHHISHTEFAGYSLIVPTAAAACEIVYDIILALGLQIDKKMARDLFVGIISDTGCFKFSNTTPKTFRIGAHLTEIYGSFYKINFDLLDVKSIAQIKLEREVLETLEFNRNGQIASIIIDGHANKNGEDTDMFPQIPRRIEGVLVGITYKEQEKNVWRISLRGSEAIDVSMVCALFGGGGHKRAAGATLTGSIKEVKERILAAVNSALDESDQNGRNTQHK